MEKQTNQEPAENTTSNPSQFDAVDNKDAKEPKKNKHTSALGAAAIGRSATAQVSAHSNSGLANTGTNISYEGATAPGSGGSVGTGDASGKEATGETISANSDFDQNRATHQNKEAGETEDVDEEEEKDI